MLVTLDFETYHDDKFNISEVGQIQYIHDPQFHVNMVGIKIKDEPTSVYVGSAIKYALAQLPWDKVTLLCHNAKFDGQILTKHYGHKPARYVDSMMLAGVALGASFPSLSLDYLCKYFGLAGKEKKQALTDTKGVRFTEADLGDERLDYLMEYCADDVDNTRLLYDLLRNKYTNIPADEFAAIDTTVRMLSEPKFILDRDMAREILTEERRYIKECIDDIREICGVPNPEQLLASDEQFIDELIRLGVEVPQKARDAKKVAEGVERETLKLKARIGKLRSGDVDAIKAQFKYVSSKQWTAEPQVWERGERLSGRQAEIAEFGRRVADELELNMEGIINGLCPRTTAAIGKNDEALLYLAHNATPDVQAVIKARIAVKSTLKTTRLERFQSIADACGGYLPVPLNYPGTHTLRYSGGEKLNMQNLPNGKFRKVLRAPPGKRIIVADSSQIEPRVAAWLCKETWMQEVFRKDEDLYNQTYARTFNVPFQGWGKGSKERKTGKVVALALNYNMGPGREKAFVANEFEYEYEGGLFARFLAEKDPRTMEEIREIVKAYRLSVPNVTAMWKFLSRVVKNMSRCIPGKLPVGTSDNPRYISWGGYQDSYYEKHGDNLRKVPCVTGFVDLPSGVRLTYRDLRYWVAEDEDSFSGYKYIAEQHLYKEKSPFYGYSYVKSRSSLYGGKLFENIVQCLGTGVVKYQTYQIIKRLGPIIALQVHDEVLGVVDEADAVHAAAVMKEEMSIAPHWAPGLLVKCGDLHILENYGD